MVKLNDNMNYTQGILADHEENCDSLKHFTFLARLWKWRYRCVHKVLAHKTSCLELCQETIRTSIPDESPTLPPEPSIRNLGSVQRCLGVYGGWVADRNWRWDNVVFPDLNDLIRRPRDLWRSVGPEYYE